MANPVCCSSWIVGKSRTDLFAVEISSSDKSTSSRASLQSPDEVSSSLSNSESSHQLEVTAASVQLPTIEELDEMEGSVDSWKLLCSLPVYVCKKVVLSMTFRDMKHTWFSTVWEIDSSVDWLVYWHNRINCGKLKHVIVFTQSRCLPLLGWVNRYACC